VAGVLVAAHLELHRADEAPEAQLPAVAVGDQAPVTRGEDVSMPIRSLWLPLSADPPRSPGSAPPGWVAGVDGKRRRSWGEAFGEMGAVAVALARSGP
jgi:hypothetical protein